MANCKISIT